ncbi:hypothetical protein L917_17458 [Phytophthora nicotianae]|uniref:Uncharacterized protein n=1 Tax=Phytophthora nicotianae TaxID=4792 RepID=W2KAU9_PHYNI|nr:hypothetical protein L917_17458 [Phytophthora nicotianae]ETM35593.1 hypothetical protein L914_17524 [Phytophthora nicotianae]
MSWVVDLSLVVSHYATLSNAVWTRSLVVRFS